MRRLLSVLCALAALPAFLGQSWAAIAPVGGATANSAAGGITSISITYSPTAGHAVVLGVAIQISTSVSTPTCADQNGNPLTLISSTNYDSLAYEVYNCAGFAVAGATSYKMQWSSGTVGTVSILLEEYSGVGSIYATSYTNTGGATKPTLTETLSDANDWLVGALATTATTISSGTGNLRQTENVQPKTGIFDNTAASASSVTLQSGTAAGTAGWGAAGVMLKPSTVAQTSLPLLGVGE